MAAAVRFQPFWAMPSRIRAQECLPELSELLKRSLSLLSFHLLGCENSQVEDRGVLGCHQPSWISTKTLSMSPFLPYVLCLDQANHTLFQWILRCLPG